MNAFLENAAYYRSCWTGLAISEVAQLTQDKEQWRKCAHHVADLSSHDGDL